MATFNDRSDGRTRMIYEWVLTANETGKAVRIAEYPDKSYGCWGTFGGTVTIQGSYDAVAQASLIDPTSWITLRESDNVTQCANTAAATGVILENPVWIRVIAGAGVSSVKTVIVASNRSW